jgi:hypothetical protein
MSYDRTSHSVNGNSENVGNSNDSMGLDTGNSDNDDVGLNSGKDSDDGVQWNGGNSGDDVMKQNSGNSNNDDMEQNGGNDDDDKREKEGDDDGGKKKKKKAHSEYNVSILSLPCPISLRQSHPPPPIPSPSANNNIALSASSPLAPIKNKPSVKPAASKKAPGSENCSPLTKTGTGKGLKEPGETAKPLPNASGSKKVKGHKDTKVAGGVNAAGAGETDVPPVKKRGRLCKEDRTEDKDGENSDNGPLRKRVQRSDDLAMAEVGQVTDPRVCI